MMSEIETIKNTLISVWEKNIKNDYENTYLIQEDTLKCSLYHHLRNELGELLNQHNLAILTEYRGNEFVGTNYRPDIVIVKLKDNCNEPYFVDRIEKLMFVIELKYKDSSNGSTNDIYSDCDKIKEYMKMLNDDCQFILAVIQETKWDEPFWFEEDDKKLGKNRVTELVASYKNEKRKELEFLHRCY